MTQQYPPVEQLARACPQPVCSAKYKCAPDDFRVDEILPFEPGGGGEHAWLLVRKRGCNTDWLAGQLARFAGVKRGAVSYAGLKDRFAVATQWFSVHLPGRDDVDWPSLELEGVELVSVTRHARKLQRGALKQNRFRIQLVDVDGDAEAILERCRQIGQRGVPNYFGEQRFGRGQQNLVRAENMFSNPGKRLPRHQRGLYLSTARSWMFNRILSRRIELGRWDQRMPGDVFMLEGSRACFADDASSELDHRLQSREIHPTAVLWGEGDTMARGECARLEAAVVDDYPVFRDGLVSARVESQRRSLRLLVHDFTYAFTAPDQMQLGFTLQAGAYATMVLKEIGDVSEPDTASRLAAAPGPDTGNQSRPC